MWEKSWSLVVLAFLCGGVSFSFFPPPQRQLIYGRGLSQPFSLTRCSFTLQYKIQSVFKNLSLAFHPLVLPVLGDVCSSLLFFPWDVCLRACRWLRSCYSMASYASRFLVVWFLILFSLLSFYASENIFRTIGGSENAVLSFLSHTFFLAEVMTFWVE